MTERIAARPVTLPGFFRIALPEGWEWETEGNTFTAFHEESADDVTVLQISIMGLGEPAEPGDGSAETMLDNYIGFLEWDVDPAQRAAVPIGGGDGARFRHRETADQPMKPVPSGAPTMWQVWFAVQGERFAHISQQVVGAEDPERALELGRWMVESSFEWLDPAE